MTYFFQAIPKKAIPKKAIQKKSHPQRNGCNFNGALTGTRTQDPVIKSHLLYQLSYERLMLYNIAPVFENFKLKFEKKFKKIQILPQISFHWTFFLPSQKLGGNICGKWMLFFPNLQFLGLFIFFHIFRFTGSKSKAFTEKSHGLIIIFEDKSCQTIVVRFKLY